MALLFVISFAALHSNNNLRVSFHVVSCHILFSSSLFPINHLTIDSVQKNRTKNKEHSQRKSAFSHNKEMSGGCAQYTRSSECMSASGCAWTSSSTTSGSSTSYSGHCTALGDAGFIIGMVVGVTVFVCIIITCCVCRLRRRQAAEAAAFQQGASGYGATTSATGYMNIEQQYNHNNATMSPQQQQQYFGQQQQQPYMQPGGYGQPQMGVATPAGYGQTAVIAPVGAGFASQYVAAASPTGYSVVSQQQQQQQAPSLAPTGFNHSSPVVVQYGAPPASPQQSMASNRSPQTDFGPPPPGFAAFPGFGGDSNQSGYAYNANK